MACWLQVAEKYGFYFHTSNMVLLFTAAAQRRKVTQKYTALPLRLRAFAVYYCHFDRFSIFIF
jgi:hypothetical protein